MRLHITLDDAVVKQLDRRTGRRQRSSFITEAVKQALEDEQRWDLIESAVGSISDQEHVWDEDPGKWVHQERRAGLKRLG